MEVSRSRDRVSTVDMRAVAEKAGVALSSVSRVLNHHPDVSPDMRRKVTAAADMLGYEPDLLAQSLRRGRTKLVGFVVRDISNPFFADIVRGAEDRLRQDGYAILLTNSESDPELDAVHIHLLSRRRVDGLMVSVASEAHPATLRALESARSPIVLLDREVPGLTAAAVVCDHASGVQKAVSALFDLGHRRIGMVLGLESLRPTRDRVAGYLAAHRLAGGSVDAALIRYGSYEEDSAASLTRQLLDLDSPPSALIVGGAQLLTGVVLTLRDRGVHVGRDLALVACDQTSWLELVEPSLAVVAADPQQVGVAAAELLLEMLQGAPPRQVVVPTVFIPRGSLVPPLHRQT